MLLPTPFRSLAYSHKGSSVASAKRFVKVGSGRQVFMTVAFRIHERPKIGFQTVEPVVRVFCRNHSVNLFRQASLLGILRSTEGAFAGCEIIRRVDNFRVVLEAPQRIFPLKT